MNDYIQNCLESGQKCSQWFVDHSAGIPAGSFFRDTCDAIDAVVNNMEDVAGHLAAAGSEAHGQTDVKGSNREVLIAVMTRNLNAAKAAEPLNPGTEDRYYFRRNLSNENLLAAARSHVEGGNTDEDLLKNYGAPATWVADTQAAADAFEASFDTQAAATGSRIGYNAELNTLNDQLGQLKRTAGYMIENYFANDVAALASWKSAAHVERP